MKNILFALVFITVLVSCKKEETELLFEEFTLEKTSEIDCNADEENCTYISLKIPRALENDNISKQINSKIDAHIVDLLDYQDEGEFKSLDQLGNAFIKNYENTANEFPEYNIPWEASIIGKVLYESTEIISIEFDLALFTGGAHGYTSTTFLNFDKSTGKLLAYNDLFTSEFTNYVEESFREKFDINPDENINSTGLFFENDQFQLPINFGIDEEKVILIYNSYEIASYAEGDIDFEIYYTEIEDYLKF